MWDESRHTGMETLRKEVFVPLVVAAAALNCEGSIPLELVGPGVGVDEPEAPLKEVPVLGPATSVALDAGGGEPAGTETNEPSESW
jgi:hypothetical protein